MTETTHSPDTESCTRSRCILTLIIWAVLLVCITTALIPTLPSALFLTSISGSLCLLFFIAQIVG